MPTGDEVQTDRQCSDPTILAKTMTSGRQGKSAGDRRGMQREGGCKNGWKVFTSCSVTEGFGLIRPEAERQTHEFCRVCVECILLAE